MYHVVLLAALLTVRGAAFAVAPIRWSGLSAERFVLAPRSFPKDNSDASQMLTLRNHPSRSFLRDPPLFSAKADQTIAWNDPAGKRELCIEAPSGAVVRLNRCNAGPTQLWDIVPQGEGRKHQIQMKGTHQCIAVVDDKQDGLSIASVQLRECAHKLTQSWELEDPVAVPTQRPSPDIALASLVRFAITFSAMLFLIAALLLRASSWRARKAQSASFSSCSAPLSIDMSGVCLKANDIAPQLIAVMAASPKSVEDGAPKHNDEMRKNRRTVVIKAHSNVLEGIDAGQYDDKLDCSPENPLHEYSPGTRQLNDVKDESSIGEECDRLLEIIGSSPEGDLIANGFKPLTVGFANHVWAARLRGLPVVVKRYTDLVSLRLDAASIGVADVEAGKTGLGPHVLYSSPQGLVMDYVDGRTLEEADIHNEDYTLLENVARAVAKLHQGPIPAVCDGPPMLWRSIDKTLEAASKRPELWPNDMHTIDFVAKEIANVKAALRKLSPSIVFGHGDLKPSNFILGTTNFVLDGRESNIRIIDHELGGPNYRAFDLMKIFRTALQHSETSMEHFLKIYSESLGPGSPDAARLRDETKLFEPLTWLEAACFFLALPQYKPRETPRWHALAIDRWRKYELTKHVLF